MKVVHLIFSFNIGGAETMLVDIINHQVKSSQVFLVIINDQYDHDLLDTIDDSVIIKKIDRKKGGKSILPLLKLNKYLWNISPDAIHCHNHNNINLLIPQYRKICFCTIHDIGINKKNFHKYKMLFAISKVVKKDIADRSVANVSLVYNGVKTVEIKSKEHFSLTGGKFGMVVVSRLKHEKKGQDVLLQAISILNQKGISNIQLDLIGSGQSESYLKSLSVELGIDNSVRFLGSKNRSFIYDNLRNYDLLVQPSIYEGFGLTVIEAMAAKTPILVSNIDGPMELIKNGEYGFYFETKNPSALANAIIELIAKSKNGELEDKVHSAFDYVSENFQISDTSRKYLEFYQKATN